MSYLLGCIAALIYVGGAPAGQYNNCIQSRSYTYQSTPSFKEGCQAGFLAYGSTMPYDLIKDLCDKSYDGLDKKLIHLCTHKKTHFICQSLIKEKKSGWGGQWLN